MLHSNKRIASQYAKALLRGEIGLDEVDRLTGEFRALAAAFGENEQIREFFTTLVTPKQKKLQVIRDLGGKLGLAPLTVRMLEAMIRRDRMAIIGDVAEELQSASDRLHRLVRLTVTTAYEPSQGDLKEMADRISEYFGSQAVVERRIDKDIIGGFIVEGEGTVIDLSVRGQINRALRGR